MRADRLVAILMLLQTRGRVTAAEVAGELEVSERTARRDLEALGVAGLPIYSQQGRNGGWELIGGARTDLSGLTADEARALFLVAGPSSSATPEVRAALRKLVRALPEPFRADAQAAASAVLVDPIAWGRGHQARPEPPHLEALQRAVIEGVQVVVGYVARDRAVSTRVVHPLGLASKGSSWYLVGDTEAGQRTFRVDRVTSCQPTGDPVVRPDGFDLAAAWRMIVSEMTERRIVVWARGTARPDVVGPLRGMFGPQLHIGPADEHGRVEVEIGGQSALDLAWNLAGFGDALAITAPSELRTQLARIGAELLATYDTAGESHTG
jgi:predicted DNA-binding transcriptional regulator YafY